MTRSATTGMATFYTSADGQTWTQLGAAVASTPGSIYAGTQALGVGSYGPGSGDFLTGNVYDAELRAGIGGSVVASPNFAAASGTSFTDPQANTWTVGGAASLHGGPALAPATTYTYRVQAISPGGTSSYSNIATSTTPSA